MKKRPKASPTPQEPKKAYPIREGSLLHQLLQLVADSIVRNRKIGGNSKS